MPYIVIFLAANFFFIYVAIVYLLKYWDRKEETPSKRFPTVTVIISAFQQRQDAEKMLEQRICLRVPQKTAGDNG